MQRRKINEVKAINQTEKLSTALLVSIFSCNSAKQLYRSASVCKSFFKAANNVSALRNVYVNSFGHLPFSENINEQLHAARIFKCADVESGDEDKALRKFINKFSGANWTHYYLGMLSFKWGSGGDEGLRHFIYSMKVGDYRSAQILCEHHNKLIWQTQIAKMDLLFPLVDSFEKGNRGLAVDIGRIYRLGIGTTKSDVRKAEEYLLIAIKEKGDLNAVKSLSEIYFKGVDAGQANADDFKKVIELVNSIYLIFKNSDIANFLANLYKIRAEYCKVQKNLVEQDVNFGQAMQWYLVGHKLGSAYSAFEVGMLYLSGNGMKNPDKVAANDWLVEAYERGYKTTAKHIAVFIDAGLLDGRDEQKIYWKQRAALCGDFEASRRLAHSYSAEYKWNASPAKVWWVLNYILRARELQAYLEDFEASMANEPFIQVVLDEMAGNELNTLLSKTDIELYRKVGKEQGLLDDEMQVVLDRIIDKINIREAEKIAPEKIPDPGCGCMTM